MKVAHTTITYSSVLSSVFNGSDTDSGIVTSCNQSGLVKHKCMYVYILF
jgi:hypothetical protein